jgi:hypothetical protein
VLGVSTCLVVDRPAPRPIYANIKNYKNGELEECFFIRTGNSINKLSQPSEINNYSQTRWPPQP